MNWKIHRLEEGDGFVANRIWFDCLTLSGIIYGESWHQDRRILLPCQIYENFALPERYKGWQ